jgi:hypothetical protein
MLNDHKSRDHALLSASSSHRWLECPPSAIAAEAYPAQDTEFTREGTLAHEVAEWIASGRSKNENLAKGQDDGITAEMIDCARGYADYIQEQIRGDQKLILLEQKVDFSEWVPDGFGTADCIIIQGEVMDVIDYKYGKGVAVSAEDNPQMKLYGLGALYDYGFLADVQKVRLHIFQPRINNVSVYELSTDDLLKWGDEVVKPVAAVAAKGEGDYKAGNHCKFCPHAGRCRELTKLCTETVKMHDFTAKVPVLAPFEVAEILELEPIINLWLKRVRDQALSSMLAGESVPGYKVVAGRGSRAWACDIDVAKILEDKGYSREDFTETKLLSVAQMEKAIGKKKVAELLAGQILSHTGAPTIATEKDRRPAYNPADDFENIE